MPRREGARAEGGERAFEEAAGRSRRKRRVSSEEESSSSQAEQEEGEEVVEGAESDNDSGRRKRRRSKKGRGEKKQQKRKKRKKKRRKKGRREENGMGAGDGEGDVESGEAPEDSEGEREERGRGRGRGRGKKAKARELIEPGFRWRRTPEPLLDFVDRMLQGVIPVLMSLEELDKLSENGKDRLLRFLNECCNRIMEELPNTRCPRPGMKEGSDYSDLSRRIKILVPANEKKAQQVREVLRGIDKTNRELEDLTKTFRDLEQQKEQLLRDGAELPPPPKPALQTPFLDRIHNAA